MRPMATFNPDVPCMVHDELNDDTLEWKPEWASHYRENAKGSGVVSWDRLMLNGWRALG